jgi:diguanylate cyclase (GGDEF)-like protein
MSRVGRAITPLLAIQAGALVLITGVAIAWTVQGVREWRTTIEVPQQTIRLVEARVHTARIAPYDFLGTQDLSARDRGQRASAEAHASLGVLGRLMPDFADEVAQTQSALRMLDSAADGIWDGVPLLEGATPSTTLLAEADLELSSAMGILSSRVTHHATNQPTVSWMGMAGMWGAAFGIYLVTGLTARRRFVRARRSEETDLSAAIGSVTEALNAAREGDELPTIKDHPITRSFAQAVDQLAGAMVDLHASNKRIRRQFTFRHELVDALDLAETEDEVVRTAVRAARVAFPKKRFQLLVTGSDDEPCTPVDESAPVACSLQKTESCPAVRKACTLHHHPDMGLARCPRIKNDATVLTCSPLSVNGQSIGVVQLVGDALDDGQEELLEALSGAVSGRMGVVRDLAERDLAAGTDPLTGLANRRAMDEHLKRLDGSDVPYAVITADLDHFKTINDTHGHDVGDRCLQLFANILHEVSRDTDTAARPGGEEFALILSGAGVDAGMAVASRIRAMLAQATRRQGPGFTASLGIAARPQHGDRAEEVLRAADVALYDAKDQGRDQCVAAIPMSLEIVG